VHPDPPWNINHDTFTSAPCLSVEECRAFRLMVTGLVVCRIKSVAICFDIIKMVGVGGQASNACERPRLSLVWTERREPKDSSSFY